MTDLTIDLPEELNLELKEVASELKQTPAKAIQLALSYFLQSTSLESAIEGMARLEDGELVDFPELKDELGIEMKFHTDAMTELDAMTEGAQIEVLEEVINRISEDEDDASEEGIDLVLQETETSQLLLSVFPFGEVVYEIGDHLTLYHIALNESDDADEDFDEVDEDDLDLDLDEDEDEDIRGALEEEEEEFPLEEERKLS